MSTRALSKTTVLLVVMLCAIIVGQWWLQPRLSPLFNSGPIQQLFQSTSLTWLTLHAGILSVFALLQVASIKGLDIRAAETNLQSSLVFLALISTAWTMFPVFKNGMLGQPDAGQQISPYLATLYAKLIVTFSALLLCYFISLLREFWIKSAEMFGHSKGIIQFGLALVIVFLGISTLTGFIRLWQNSESFPELEEFALEPMVESMMEIARKPTHAPTDIELPTQPEPPEPADEEVPAVAVQFEEKVNIDTQKVDESLTKSLTGFELPENVYFDFSSYNTRELYPAFLYQQGNRFLVENRWIATESEEGIELLKRYPERPVISLPNNRQLMLNTQVLNTLVTWLQENASLFQSSQEIRFLLRKSDTRIQLITPSSPKHPSQTLLIF